MTGAHPVTVVGGGLAGLATALVLAESGHGVRLLDRAGGPRRKGGRADPADTVRTTTLNPLAMKVMRRIGALDRMERGKRPLVPVTAIHVSDERQGRGGGGDDRLLGWETGEPLAHVARNSDMAEAAGAIAGRHRLVDIHRGVEIAGMAPSEDRGGIELVDAKGGTWTAGLVVACDGAASPLREKAGIRVVERDPGQTAIVADIGLEAPHRNTAWQRFLASGPVALMPLDAPRLASLVWTLPTGEAADLMEAEAGVFSERLTEDARSPFGALRLKGERRHWELRLRHAVRPRAERLALLGDAAHAIHPLAGQGFNLAIGDMVGLAESLDWARSRGADPGSDAVLARYARKRLVETAGMAIATDGLNVLFGRAPAPLRSVAGAAMAMLDRTPLKNAFMEFANGGLAMGAAGGGGPESDWTRDFLNGRG